MEGKLLNTEEIKLTLPTLTNNFELKIETVNALMVTGSFFCYTLL